MNYKEVVEQILKNREELVCVETNLLQDFSGGDGTHCFAVWCKTNQLSCYPLTGKGPKKLLLKKTTSTQILADNRSESKQFENQMPGQS